MDEYWDKAKHALQQRKFEEALSLFLVYAQHNPQHEDSLFYAAYCYSVLGCWDKAILVYQALLRLLPESGRAWELLGTAQYRIGETHDAIQSLTKANRLRPGDALTCCSLGIALREVNREAEAVAAFEEAIDHQQEFAYAHFELGMTRVALNQWEKAEKAFLDALHIEPEFARALFNLAVVRLILGCRKDTLRHYEVLNSVAPCLGEELRKLLG